LSGCSVTGNGIVAPTGIAFYASDFAYVADYGGNQVLLCTVGSDGSLSACAPAGTSFQYPVQLAINGNTLYATNAAGGITTCAIAGTGALSGCTEAAGSGTVGIAANSTNAYIGVSSTTIDACAISVTGTLSATCTSVGPGNGFDAGFSTPDGITLSGGYAYIASLENGNGSVNVCAVNPDGSLSGCTPSLVGTQPADVAINGNEAFVDDASGNIYLCAIGPSGSLGSCVVATGGSNFSTGMLQIVVH
jgi:hypothetical protein